MQAKMFLAYARGTERGTALTSAQATFYCISKHCAWKPSYSDSIGACHFVYFDAVSFVSWVQIRKGHGIATACLVVCLAIYGMCY